MSEFNIRRASIDSFNTAPDDVKATAQHIVACYHYRTDTKHNDGSIGDIRITPKEFHDLISYLFAVSAESTGE